MASVGVLAAGVAHEINNPLAAVVGNLEIALSDIKEDEKAQVPESIMEVLRDARDAGDRIRTIVKDLRLFSRVEQERREPLTVEHVLESTLRIARNEIRHRATLVRDYGRVPPVLASDARLGQVFLNLVINAAHAIPEGNCDGNSIRISTSLCDTGRVLVRIADTGGGIPPEVQSRIFAPFFTTKPVGVGTGLGLSICQRIVASFGGELWFDTTPGVGTVFTVALPTAANVAIEEPEAAPASQPSRRGSVLVVDDDTLVAQVIRRALAGDHDVVSVDSAEHGLELLRRGERYDVIVCDLMMPQITGMELHGAVMDLDSWQASRMIFITGGAFTPRARAFLDAVPDHRLEKPFDVHELRAVVNSIVL